MNILVLEDSIYRQKDFRSNFPCATIVDKADQCIGILEDAKEPWDLVFLDHDLDGQAFVDPSEHNTGSEVVRWVKANKPEIKKIIIHSLNKEVAHIMALDLLASEYNAQAIPFLDLDWQKLYEEIEIDN